jgi:hypothetical protein
MADRLRSYLSSIFSWHAARDDDFASPFVRRMARTKPRERARDHTLDDDAIRIVEKVASELKTPFARLDVMSVSSSPPRPRGGPREAVPPEFVKKVVNDK